MNPELTLRELLFHLYHGENEKILEKVNVLLARRKDLDLSIITKLTNFKTVALMRLGRFREAEKIAREMLSIIRKENHPILCMETTLILSEAAWQQGKLSEAIHLLAECEQLIEHEQGKLEPTIGMNLKGKIHFHRAVVHQKKGEAQIALQHFQEAQSLLEGSKDFHHLARCLNGMGLVYWTIGKLEEARECFEQARNYSEQIDDIYSLAYAYNNMGIFFRHKGDLKAAFESLMKSKKLWEKMGNLHGVATALINIGVILELQHDLKRALECYDRSAELYEKVGDNIARLSALQNAATIRDKLGYIKERNQLLEEIANIQKRMGIKPDLITTYINLADAYLEIGDLNATERILDECEQLLTEVGNKLQEIRYLGLRVLVETARNNFTQANAMLQEKLKLSKELGNPQEIATTLFELVELYTDHQNWDELGPIFSELEEVAKTHHEDRFINLLWLLARALILKRKEHRLLDQLKALAYLDEVIQEEGEFFTSMKIKAYLTKMELLLEYVMATNDSDALDDFKNLIDTLMRLAKENYVHPLLINLYVLKAQQEIFNLNFTEARKLFSVAEHLAEERGLIALAMKISMQHDALLDLLSDWRQRDLKTMPLSERLKLSGLKEQVQEMAAGHPPFIEELPEEHPVLFAVYDESGLPLYTRAFGGSPKLQELLVGSFLTALTTFARQVFDQALERAKMGQYNLIVKAFDSLRVFYIFKGHTYPAQQKIDEFLLKMQQNIEILRMFQEARRMGRELTNQEKQVVDTWVNEIILSMQPT